MKNLTINKTKSTPEIQFDVNKKTLSIEGVSLPENVSDFYRILDIYLSDYVSKVGNDKLIIYFDVIYMNTSSSKKIFNLFKYCMNTFNELKIIWVYEEGDDETLELGEDFEKTLDIKFEFKQKP